jgi:murein L,D-transpeptidase YafK
MRVPFRHSSASLGLLAAAGLAVLVAGAAAAAELSVEQIEAVNPGAFAPNYTAADRARRLREKSLAEGSRVMIRVFKQESQLELWMEQAGRFELFATYPVCFWSGSLGPKLREGDKQAPEGFYSVGQGQLYPVGRRPRSFDIGFPNVYDKAYGRTGSYIFVHGGCTSTGCFAMTDRVMDEIYALTEAALREGQERVEVHTFPFRMTEANLAAHAESSWYDFWMNLKDGYDRFERTHVPPRVSVCGRRYVFDEPVAAADAPMPANGGAAGQLGMCEDALDGVVSVAVPPRADVAEARIRGIASRAHRRRAAARNARRGRMAAHAKRMRTTAASRASRER